MNKEYYFELKRIILAIIISVFLVFGLKTLLYYRIDDILARLIMILPSLLLVFLIQKLNVVRLPVKPKIAYFDFGVLLLPIAVIVLNLIATLSVCLRMKYIPENTLYLLVMCLCVGFLEELIFRGLFININYCKVGFIITAVVVSALVFGLSHFSYKTPQMVITNIGYGFVYGYIFIRFRTIIVPALLHSIVDFSILWSDSAVTEAQTVSEQLNKVGSGNTEVIVPSIIMVINIAMSTIAIKESFKETT